MKMPEPAHRRLAKTPPSSPAPIAPAASDPPRFPHRALQTLWQAGMQMRRRPRPWPQVLSVGELSRLAAANGLCARKSLTRRRQSSWPTTTAPARSWRRSARSTANSCAAARRSKRLAMSEALSALHAPIDPGLGGVLLANMLASWLDRQSAAVTATAEASDESQDQGTSPEQTGLHLLTPVDAGPSAPPSGEHGAPVCTAREGAGTGLERIPDSHARPGPGKDGNGDDGAGGLQDLGGGCLDGPSGRGVCPGSLATGALESRLASAAGAVRAHRHAGDRRRWLLRSGGLQRRTACSD